MLRTNRAKNPLVLCKSAHCPRTLWLKVPAPRTSLARSRGQSSHSSISMSLTATMKAPKWPLSGACWSASVKAAVPEQLW